MIREDDKSGWLQMDQYFNVSNSDIGDAHYHKTLT